VSVGFWDQSYPPSVFAPPVGGATAGSPGAWTPSGAQAPATLAEANALGYSGAAWTTGQYVELADGSDVYWNGTAFVAGRAPVVVEEDEPAPAKRTRKRADTEEA